MLIAPILTALFVSSSLAWTLAPDFCNGLDCPQYTAVCNSSRSRGSEVRTYAAADWASVELHSGVADYDSLTDYFSGANEALAKLPVTTPVVNVIAPCGEPIRYTTTNFTISLLVPFSRQGRAPRPIDPHVQVVRRPSVTVAVRSFDGFLIDWSVTVAPQFLALERDLEQAGLRASRVWQWVAQYSDKSSIYKMRNEVWLEVDAKTARC
jgi:hypothetical protein